MAEQRDADDRPVTPLDTKVEGLRQRITRLASEIDGLMEWIQARDVACAPTPVSAPVRTTTRLHPSTPPTT